MKECKRFLKRIQEYQQESLLYSSSYHILPFCTYLKSSEKFWSLGPAQIVGNQYYKSTEYLRFSQCKTKQKIFLWKIVMRILYDNEVNKKKQWLSSGQTPLDTPKPEIQHKKSMICVYWDQKGVIYYDLLEPD